MIARVLNSRSDYGPLIARLALGLVMFPHGAQKMLGWFGGYGFGGTMEFFTQQMGFPWIVGFLIILIEFAGSLTLLVGLCARPAAVGISTVMLGAIATVHAEVGFFMDWSGQLSGEGFEYHLLAIGLALVVIVQGAGAYSLDDILMNRMLNPNSGETSAASPAFKRQAEHAADE